MNEVKLLNLAGDPLCPWLQALFPNLSSTLAPRALLTILGQLLPPHLPTFPATRDWLHLQNPLLCLQQLWALKSLEKQLEMSVLLSENLNAHRGLPGFVIIWELVSTSLLDPKLLEGRRHPICVYLITVST